MSTPATSKTTPTTPLEITVTTVRPTTVAGAYQLSVAHHTLTRGFGGDAGGGKPVCVIRTGAAKLALARNMRRLSAVVTPHQEEIEALRQRLMTDERKANPEAKELSPERAAELYQALATVNARPVELDLGPIAAADIDLDKVEGEEGFQVLAILEGVVIR